MVADTNPHKLARWQSHKIVAAGRIKTLAPPGKINSAGWLLQVENAAGVDIEILVSQDTFARGVPNPNDYLVIYDDGYVSWSPRKQFEDGYRRA